MTRWRCPSCRLWVTEPMSKACAKCREGATSETKDLRTICGKCEREWPTDHGRTICPWCGFDDSEGEENVIRDDSEAPDGANRNRP